MRNTPADNNTLEREAVFPLNYLNYFWRPLDLPLINCEIEFDFRWATYYIISEISETSALVANRPAQIE